MRNYLYAIIFTLVISHAFSLDVTNLRKMLYESKDNTQVAKLFFKQMSMVKNSDEPLLVGFKAMSYFMLCQVTYNPLSKINYFNQGKYFLKSAIQNDQHNIELLFFRFTIQNNAPSILGYSDDLVSDKLILANYLKDNSGNSKRDHDLYQKIRDYLLQCNLCNEKEKELYKRLS